MSSVRFYPREFVLSKVERHKVNHRNHCKDMTVRDISKSMSKWKVIKQSLS